MPKLLLLLLLLPRIPAKCKTQEEEKDRKLTKRGSVMKIRSNYKSYQINSLSLTILYYCTVLEASRERKWRVRFSYRQCQTFISCARGSSRPKPTYYPHKDRVARNGTSTGCILIYSSALRKHAYVTVTANQSWERKTIVGHSILAFEAERSQEYTCTSNEVCSFREIIVSLSFFPSRPRGVSVDTLRDYCIPSNTPL